MTTTVHDVAILSDFRHPDGAPAAVADEVRAQARAGLTTVLVHVPAPDLPAGSPFDPLVTELIRDGAAELAAEGEQVTARLLVVRQVAVAEEDPGVPPRVRAGRTVLVLDRVAGFAEAGKRVAELFGAGAEWAPAGPAVRAGVLAAEPGAVLTRDDWHDVIDGSAWWREQPVPGPVPLVGCLGPLTWPSTRQELLQAYPDVPDIRFRMLGDVQPALDLLGRRPANWEIAEPGTAAAAGFPRDLDLLVHLPDPGRDGVSTRPVLQALAAGVPVIAGAALTAVFGDAVLGATPADVPELVRELYGNRDRYRSIALRGREFAEVRHGWSGHLARLAARGVRPGAPPSPALPPPRPAPLRGVLLVSDDGDGLGQLSRLMAIGRRLPEGTPVVVATQSHGAPVAHREGFLTEYIPSRAVLGLPRQAWSELLRSRLEHLIDLHRPAVVAVDGVPHDGIVAAASARPASTWVWVRRSMWRRDAGREWLDRRSVFDHILEPGEFAAAADEGATVADRDGVREVAPVTYLDPAELIAPAAARAALGIGEGRPAALIRLGAGAPAGDVTGRIARNLRRAGFEVLVAEPAITAEPAPPVAGTRPVRFFPLSRYLHGFDLVVSTSGYGAFHELIGAGVPTVFVPDRATAVDDQVSRARFAAAAGAALIVEDPDGDDLDRVLDHAVRPDVRAALSRRCAEVAFGNGAAEAAGWLSDFAHDGSDVHV